MNSHPSALVFALYLLGGGLILGIARWVFVAADQRPAFAVPGVEPRSVSASAEPSGPNPAVSHYALARANQRLQDLEASVQQTRDLLERRTTLLHEKQAEIERLRDELDRSIGLLFAVLAEDAASASPTLNQERSRRIEGELTALRTELQLADQLQRDQSQQLDELRAALLEAEVEIADLQFASAEELTLLAERQAILASVARDTLAQLGATVVPLLTPLLRDPQPEVRGWAADTLGRIGMDAETAIPILTELLVDDDASVRQSARRSLAAIEP